MKPEINTRQTPSAVLTFLGEKRKEKQFMQTAEISFTIFFICFFLLVAIRPTVFTITDLLGEIKAKRELSAKLKNQINNVIQAQTVFSQIQADYDLINSSLPERYSFYHASNQLKGIASQANIGLNKISFNLNDSKDEKIPYYSFSLNNPIDLFQISNFINGLTQNRRSIQISNFSIAPADDSDQNPNPEGDQPIVSAGDIVIRLATKIFYLPSK